MTKCDEAPGPNYGQHCLHAYDDGVVCCWCGTGFDVDVPLREHGHFAPKCPLDEYDCGNSYCETHHSQCAKGGQCWHENTPEENRKADEALERFAQAELTRALIDEAAVEVVRLVRAGTLVSESSIAEEVSYVLDRLTNNRKEETGAVGPEGPE